MLFCKENKAIELFNPRRKMVNNLAPSKSISRFAY